MGMCRTHQAGESALAVMRLGRQLKVAASIALLLLPLLVCAFELERVSYPTSSRSLRAMHGLV